MIQELAGLAVALATIYAVGGGGLYVARLREARDRLSEVVASQGIAMLTAEARVAELEARCDSRISSIIADGYDIGEATDDIGDAVAEWVKNGTPNPFEAEADAVLDRRALDTKGEADGSRD